MNMKILILVITVLFMPTPIKADTPMDKGQLLQQFSRAFHDRDLSQLDSLLEPGVKIPEMRENTLIHSLQTLPSPEKNRFVMIGYFKEDCTYGRESDCLERIAFIWEVTVKDNIISKIRVVSDMANPHMNELILTKEYKEKFEKEILVPAHFPFKMTHVEGKISSEKLVILYKNTELPALLEIQAEPANRSLNMLKERGFEPVSLPNSNKGYIRKTSEGYGLIFDHNKMRYQVKLETSSSKYKPSKNELIKIANSMLFMNEPWAKYPDNSEMNFQDADSFYRSLDKDEYTEFEHAKLTIREKTTYDNINEVLSRADQYGPSRVGGDGFHPKRQVYVFVTVSHDGTKNTMVVFDAETGMKISESRNWEK